jgi:hypothetical protein
MADFKVLQAHAEKLAGMLSGGQAVGAGRQLRRPLFINISISTCYKKGAG